MYDFKLSDLFENCSDGMMTVALNSSGEAIHIKSVPSGLECKCVCPACNRPLVARKGKLISHHFAHQKEQFDGACAHAGETILHRWAKEVLSKHLMINFPAVVGQDDFGPLVVHPERIIRFESVELEKRVGAVVPDVIGHVGGRQLFIEIKVTHACPPEKLEKLSKLDVGVIEVDLNGYRDYQLTDLEEVVIKTAPRQILQARALNDIEPALKDRVEKLTASLSQAASALIKKLRYRERRLSNEDDYSSALHNDPRSFVIDDKLEDLSFFDVPDEEWKAWTLSVFRKSPNARFEASDFVKEARRKRWIAPESDSTSPLLLDYIRTNLGYRLYAPEDHIYQFLHYIFIKGLLTRPTKHGFKLK